MLEGLLRSSLTYFLGNMLLRGLSLILLPLYTRFLTPADYGILAVCTTTSVIFSLVATPPVSAALRILYHKVEREEYRALMGTVSLWAITFPLIPALLLEAFGPRLIEGLMPGVPWSPYLHMAVWIGYFMISSIDMPSSLFIGQQRAPGFVLFNVASALLLASSTIYFVVIRRDGALGSLKGQMITHAVMAAAAHVMFWRSSRLEVSGRRLAETLKLCVPLMPYSLGMWALNISDRWILGRFVSLADLGIYNVAYTLASVGTIIGTAVDFAFAPAYFKQSSEQSFRAGLPRFLLGNALVQIWLALACSVMAPEILAVMVPAEYRKGWALMPWIAAGYCFFTAVYRPCLTVILNQKRTGVTAVIVGAAAAFNIALNLMLVPRYGIWAAAATTLAAFALMAALALRESRKFESLPFPWPSMAQAAAVAGAALWFGIRWLSFDALGTAVLAKCVLLAAAAALMAQRGGLGRAEATGVWRAVRARA